MEEENFIGKKIYVEKRGEGKKYYKVYDVVKKLGEGSQGSVYMSLHNDIKVAIKIFKPPTSLKSRQKIRSEINILKKISKHNCNTYISCYIDSGTDQEGNYIIEMEYIDGQNLYDYTKSLSRHKKQDMKILIEIAYLVIKAIVIALKNIHQSGILHNDIKLNNIVVERETRIPKLVDFGFACETFPKDSSVCRIEGEVINKCCTDRGRNMANVAPEYIINRVRYPQSDIWSLGTSMYTLFTRDIIWKTDPFERFTTDTLKKKIRHGKPERLNTGNKLLNDIINGMTEKDITQRLTADQILEMLEQI